MHATTFTPAQNKRQHASLPLGAALVARRVCASTADRGVTMHAHAGMHAHRQTQTPAPTSNTRGFGSVTDRPTFGSARTPSVRATTFTLPQNKSQHASPRWGDLHSLRRVEVATANRGGTASVRRHARTHADAFVGTDAKHAWRRQREKAAHAHPQCSARNGIHPGAKQKSTRFATHEPLAMLDRPPPTVA